jgi:hypothetical protein
MNTCTITVSSTCSTTVERMFPLLKQLNTLQQIASPYASFAPVDGSQNLTWQPGETYRFHFRLFGLIPFGIHTIQVVDFAPGGILTREGNPHVPVWNHRILLETMDEQTLRYTDEVEIGAGWKTPFVSLWARIFYRHRQRKWRKLLADKA